MDPTQVVQEAQPANANSTHAGADLDLASSTVGADITAADEGRSSSISKGHPVGVVPTPTEKPRSNDISPTADHNVATQIISLGDASSIIKQTSAPSATVDTTSSPVLAPFLQPHLTAQLPTSQPLTADQENKYSKLLAAVQTWTSVPASAKTQEDTPLTPSEKLWLTRECLLRYLRASKWVVPTATNRLLATLTWRREYGVERLTEDYISEENETGKQVILGYDNQGKPCLYLNPHKQNTKGKEKQVQHLVFMLERCIDLMAPGVETLALLVNFKESRKGENASVGQGRQVLSILQNHYPERLGKALVQDVPWLIWGFFKAISPFIDPLTREKLKFDEDLRQLVPPEQLIKAYGGEIDFDYIHNKYWPALNELAGTRRREMLQRWEMAGSIIGERESYLKGLGQSVRSTEEGEKGLENAMASTGIKE